ncbi:hypothetical protein GN277_12645 [Lachnospiraceae bacterium WCA-9-b2]|uniref:Uncharacterized protein n=1 Tax=Sporofaciens musculi TaxID=2681861 RepID=A0A7X3SJB7_9FIRM|nr:hypothetical protein [Sporofaciens musculi]MXP76210.1 hypothetical protein [Sporofaciens musculi]
MYYEGDLPEHYKIDTIFKNGSNIEKGIQRIWFHDKLPFYKVISLSNWYKEEFDTIIIEVLQSKKDIIAFIKSHYPRSRIILWYWNTVKSTQVYPDDPICRGCELWSFDKKDCNKYGIKYNTQFYNKNIKLPMEKETTDIFFLGADKGRGKQLESFKKELEEKGFSCFFHVTENGRTAQTQLDYKKSIAYESALKYLAKSRAILDVGIQGQQGLTLRVLEALFFSKKLITTNKDIKNYDFYLPSNIFILNDNMECIPQFMDIPYEPVNKEIIEYYEFSNWIRRFEN